LVLPYVVNVKNDTLFLEAFMSLETEILLKERKVRKFMKQNKLDAVMLTKFNNFAWFTCGGDNHVVIASDFGAVSIIITGDKKYLIANNIEAGRSSEEEIKGQGFIVKKFNWWEDAEKLKFIKEIVKEGVLGTDDGFGGYQNIDGKFSKLRFQLNGGEIKKYKWLGRKAGRAMVRVCKKIKKGYSEHKVSGLLAKELYKDGITPTVLLMAADERISKYRHPIPTDKKVEKIMMVVLCARKWGLIVSLTRLVHFGPISAELRKKHNAVVKVDSVFNLSSKPGVNIKDIFKKAQDAYKETGFASEWTLHHQGGATGYAGREYRGMANSEEVVLVNQAFAWNPSISGTKCEDTIIVRKNKIEFITPTPGWPMVEVKVGNEKVLRPDILEIKGL